MAAETVTWKSAAEIFELHNWNRNSHLDNLRDRSTNITESTICIIAIEPQNLKNLTGVLTCKIKEKSFHLQKWCQSEILLVIIQKLSEWVSMKFKEK